MKKYNLPIYDNFMGFADGYLGIDQYGFFFSLSSPLQAADFLGLCTAFAPSVNINMITNVTRQGLKIILKYTNYMLVLSKTGVVIKFVEEVLHRV